jgi:1-deoxy-D-xylulose-5-phosphate reductoisomerase
VLSGADEAAVAAFLEGRCRFDEIARVCGEVLESHRAEPLGSIDQAVAASDWGRRQAEERTKKA